MKRLFCIVDPSLKDFVGHHLEYDAATAAAAIAQDFDVVCLGHREADAAIGDQLPLRRVFSRDIWWTPPDAARPAGLAAANDAFEQDLRRACQDLPLTPEAVVFGHMITAGQLLGWARFIASLPARRRPRVVLLLRYQPDLYLGEAAEAGFRRLRTLAARGASVRLASDSDPLAAELQRLSGMSVEVLPLPHTGHFDPTAARRAWPRPLRVVSLGNAREEKGLLEIFEAIHILRLRQADQRFAFVLQVNDPEQDIVDAVARFAEAAPPGVTLLTTALSSVEYGDLLRSADIVLLPYRRSVYEARTSGVFVEAVAAGIPVVCTEGSWMGGELLRLGGAGLAIPDRSAAGIARALLRIADAYPAVSAAAEQARGPYLAVHNPARFMDALLNGGAEVGAPAHRRAAVFYPWGDAQRRASGASLRVNLMCEFLVRHGADVRLLEDSEEPPRRRGPIAYESYALLTRARKRLIARVLARAVIALRTPASVEDIYARLHLYARFDRDLHQRIDEMVRWADVVFLEYSFWADPVAEACRRHDRRLIITAHDVISNQVRSPLLRMITRALERAGLRRADHVAAMSSKDLRILDGWSLPVTLAPSAIDADRVRQPRGAPTRRLLNRLIGLADDDGLPILFFIGTDFRPNVLAAAEMRAMAARFEDDHPDTPARFLVAGSCAPAERAGLFMALGSVSEVVLRLLYANCACVLAPVTEGTGVSTKAFEALAAGAPLLATPLGVRGIEVEGGDGYIVEPELRRWPALLHALLSDSRRLATLREQADAAGRQFTPEGRFAPYLAMAPMLDLEPDDARLSDVQRGLQLDTARLAADHGLADVAVEITRHRLAVHADDAEAAALQARLLADGGPAERRQASALLVRALDAGADAIDVLRAKALLRDKDGEGEEADRARALAARLAVNRAAAPGEPMRLHARMWAAFHAGDKAWARALAWEAVNAWGERAPFDYDYLFALTESERPVADTALALAFAERALRKGADPFWTNRLIAELGRKGEAPSADVARAYQDALAAAKDEAGRALAIDGLCWVAWRRFEQRDIQAALELVDIACASTPDAPMPRYLRAECLKTLGAPLHVVVAEFERARAGGYDPIWCDLHITELLMRAPGGAELSPALQASVDRVLERRPSQTLCAEVRRRAWQAFEAGDYASALSLADAARVSWPEDPALHYMVAESLQLLERDLERALAAYDRALELGFDSFWVLFNRAQLNRKLFNAEAARMDLQLALGVTSDPEKRNRATASIADLDAISQDESAIRLSSLALH